MVRGWMGPSEGPKAGEAMKYELRRVRERFALVVPRVFKSPRGSAWEKHRLRRAHVGGQLF